jgi:hypothetical protein
MQETRGIVAGHGDQAEVGDGGDEALGEVGCAQLAAKVLDLVRFVEVEAGAVRRKVFDPVTHISQLNSD